MSINEKKFIYLRKMFKVKRNIERKNSIKHRKFLMTAPLPADEKLGTVLLYKSYRWTMDFRDFMNSEKAIPGFMPFDALMIKTIEKVQDREYRVTFKDSISNYASSINVGSRFVFKSRWNSYDLVRIINTDVQIFWW